MYGYDTVRLHVNHFWEFRVNTKKVSFSATIVTICSIKIMTSCVDYSKSIKPSSKRKEWEFGEESSKIPLLMFPFFLITFLLDNVLISWQKITCWSLWGMEGFNKRPFYGCVLSCQAFDLEWGWRWPCCDRDQYLVCMVTE